MAPRSRNPRPVSQADSPPAAQGNMPADFYPRSPCAKPDQGALGVQPSPQDHAAMTAHNIGLKAFNELTLIVTTCLTTFAVKAGRGIRPMQAMAHASASRLAPGNRDGRSAIVVILSD